MPSHPTLPGDPSNTGPGFGPFTPEQQEAGGFDVFGQPLTPSSSDAPGPGEPLTRIIPIGNGLVEVQAWNGSAWVFEEIRNERTTTGGGGGPSGPTAAELDIARRRNDLTQRQQDLDRQANDADRALEGLQTRLAQANADRDAAIAAGDLDLARERETRIGEIERERVQLEKDRFGLDQQRFGLQQELLQLDRDRFETESSQFQQQFGLSIQEFLNNQALGQQGIALNAAALGINAQGQATDAVLGAGGLLGSLGADLGDLEFRRDELLANLAANPRDFVQLNREFGGGTSFLEQLLGGDPVTGQSARLIGEQTLGPAFDALVASLMQRPELEFFNQAAERAGDIPSFEELAEVQVPPAFFPEGPPLPPELGFDPNQGGAADVPGLLPEPLPPELEAILGGIDNPNIQPSSQFTGPIPENVRPVLETFNDPNAVGAVTGGPPSFLDLLAAVKGG